MHQINLSKLLLIPLFLGVACNNGNDIQNCDEHEVAPCRVRLKKTNIRIKNKSDYDFCNVKINHGGERVNYGIVKSGETTCYRFTDTGYNYTFVFAKNRGILLQDNVLTYKEGKMPLPPGKYTYNVEVLDFEQEQLEVEVTKN